MKTNKWLYLVVALLAVLVAILPACAAETTTTTPTTTTTTTTTKTTTTTTTTQTTTTLTPWGDVYIGVPYATSGPVGTLGTSMLKGLQLAADAWNKLYGGVRINDRVYTVKLIVYDTQMNPQTAVALTTRLIQQDKPPIIIGDFISGDCLAQQPLIDDAQWPWLMNATNPALTGPTHPTTNRINVLESALGPGWWQGAAATMQGKLKLALLTSQTDFSKARLTMAQQLAPQYGFQIVAQETFSNTATDFYAVIDKIKAANPDMVYISGYNNCGTAIRQAAEKGFTPRWICDDTFITDIQAVLGSNATGVRLFAAVDPQATTPAVQLYKQYAPPDKPGMTFNLNYSLTWDTMMRALMALEKAGTIATDLASRQKIAKAIRDVVFDGVLTTGSLDQYGNVTETPRILEIQADGSIKVVAENGVLK